MASQRTLSNQLSEASTIGDLSKIKLLVSQGVDIHANNDYALRWSAYCGYLDIVKYLIVTGANIHANNNEAIRNSARYGHLEVVKYLVEHGANMRVHESYGEEENCDILMISAIHGYLDIIKYIVEKSEDIQSEYNNALRYSAKYGHLNVVKYLIIDCNMIVKQKTLKYLEKEQYLDVVKLISIRDLNKKLNNNLSSNINAMNKIHKVKI